MCIFVPSIYAMITIKQIKIKGYFGKGHFKATASVTADCIVITKEVEQIQ